MRIIGFIGLLLLAVINAVGLVISTQEGDIKGIGLMLFMVVLLTFFAYVLWRGRAYSGNPGSVERLAQGWAGESVGDFLKYQMAKSLEGRMLIVGSLLCVLMVAISVLFPEVLLLPDNRIGRATTLFAVWPILAFVLYVRICGPEYRTTIFTKLSMLAVVAAPFGLAYK